MEQRVGLILVVLGVIGVMGGVVPLVVNGMHALGLEVLSRDDFAAHGVEAMGLSVEWALLSSAMGTYLGGLLLWAGRAWRGGRTTAPLASWVYISCALAVNLTDMFVFLRLARAGAMRSRMLFLDGIALAVPLALAAWLILRRRGVG